jgi:predicted DNA binding CopG/RHH family protein
MKTKNLNIVVSEETMKTAKMLAVKNGMTLRAFIIYLIKKEEETSK